MVPDAVGDVASEGNSGSFVTAAAGPNPLKGVGMILCGDGLVEWPVAVGVAVASEVGPWAIMEKPVGPFFDELRGDGGGSKVCHG